MEITPKEEDRAANSRSVSKMEFREYLIVLGREKWLLFGLTAGAAVLALIVSLLLPPQYVTQTTLLIVPRISQQLPEDQAFPWTLSPEAYRSLALAQDLLQELIQELDLRKEGRFGAEPLSVEELKRRLRVRLYPSGVQSPTGLQYPLLTLAVTGTDPQQIRELAVAWGARVQQRITELMTFAAAQTYEFLLTQAEEMKRRLSVKAQERLQYARQNPVDLLEGTLQALLEQSSLLREEIHKREALQQELRAWRTSLEGALEGEEDEPDSIVGRLYSYLLKAEAVNAQAAEAAAVAGVRQLRERLEGVQQELSETAAQVVTARQTLEQLDRELEVLQDTYATLFQRLQDARMATAETSEPLQVLEQAIVPEEPFSPQPLLYTALAAVLGLFLSLLLVGLKQYLALAAGEAKGEAS